MLLDGRRCVRFVPEALVYHYTHIQRNDRTFLPPSTLTNHQRLAQAIETLESAVADWPDTMAAALTLKSLAHLPAARAAVPILIDLLHNHADFDVRWRVAGTLAKLPCAEGIDALIAALGDPSFYPRDEAAWALAEIGSRAATVLLEKLGLVPPAEHPLAALALGRSRYARAEEHALAMINQGMKSADNDQRRNFAYAAGEIDCARGVAELLPGLHGLLTDPDDRIKSVAVWALGALAPRVGRSIDWRAVRRLSREHPDPLVRTEAVAALGKQICASRGSSLMRDLLLAAEDGAARVRFVATQSLRLIAEDGGRFARAGLGPDPDFGVRFEQELLEMILERQPARPTERRL
jgi:HEAT repeat protein